VESTYSGLRMEAAQVLHRRPRKARKCDPGNPEALATEAIAPTSITVDVREPQHLTVSDVQVFWGGRADGIRAAALRIALASVAFWWVNGATDFKAPAGHAVSVGALFPIG
jgi:hypothetical protein